MEARESVVIDCRTRATLHSARKFNISRDPNHARRQQIPNRPCTSHDRMLSPEDLTPLYLGPGCMTRGSCKPRTAARIMVFRSLDLACPKMAAINLIQPILGWIVRSLATDAKPVH